MSKQLHLTIKGAIVALLVILGSSGLLPADSCEATTAKWASASGERVTPLVLASEHVTFSSGDVWARAPRARFAPKFAITGVLPAGSLGLPGETITWVITVTNNSATSGTDLIVTDKLPPDLRIESAEAARGEVSVSEQMVVFTLPELAPNDQATFFIYTTVQSGPANGLILNQAALVASGPEGPISQIAQAEVSVPTGLPPTGYAPTVEAPPVLERPSLGLLAMIALTLVGLTAGYVYYRGRVNLRQIELQKET